VSFFQSAKDTPSGHTEQFAYLKFTTHATPHRGGLCYRLISKKVPMGERRNAFRRGKATGPKARAQCVNIDTAGEARVLRGD